MKSGKNMERLDILNALDDLSPKVKNMQFLKFPTMANAKPGETVVFSFIIFESKKHRDKVNAMVMQDPSMNDPQVKEKPMPFDVSRMANGGFIAAVEL